MNQSKSKVCYIAPFYDGTGYSTAAINTVESLLKTDINIIVRNIKLASQIVEPPAFIKELEKRSAENITHCIQHILPPYFSYFGGIKNIGYFYTETDYFAPSNWQFYANLMDEIWVSCPENKEAAIKSGVNKPIEIVPIPCPVPAAEQEQTLPLRHLENKYIFYTIGDFSSRKNIANLVKSYFQEFSRYDNVVLILKTYVEGVPFNESNKILQEEIQKLKVSLRKCYMNNYPPIILIGDYLSPSDVQALHRTGHCFISLERGAAWNIPAMDAIANNSWVIANGWGGQTQFINSSNGDLVRYSMDSVSGMDRCPYKNLYTCYENWAEPNLQDFRRLLRDAYNKKKIGPGIESIKQLTPQSTGACFKELLNV